jgi:hypothetical protein
VPWYLRSARATFFVTPETAIQSDLWRQVVGAEPDTSLFQRAIGVRQEAGEFADGRLTLLFQPMRVDWNYEVIDDPSLNEISNLGEFPNVAEPLLDLTRRWVPTASFPSIQRLALGFSLISGIADREAGYADLRDFIDGVPDPANATDFSYQVNRPRASNSGIEGLQINRLSKWSVGGVRSVAIGPGGPVMGGFRFSLNLELDINTAANFPGPIPQARVVAVLDDLLAGAREVAERGNRF